MSSEPASESDYVLEARGLSKCYQVFGKPIDRLRQFFARGDKRYYTEFWALQDLDLQVRRGETLGIIGRNGAGKSTLLQLIAGTLKPTRGEIVRRGRITALLELGSGFHMDFTGRENIFVAGAMLGLAREQMEERMERIESFADIGDFIDRPVKTYSQGMFARLSFSVYANLDPEVFIVDEALAVGDARFRHKCMYRFHQMQEQGVAVLYVSHDAMSLKHLCNRVAWIHDGKLEQVGEPSPVVDAYLNHLFYDVTPKATAAASEAPIAADDDQGSRAATIVRCRLLDADGDPTDHVTGGDVCTIDLRLQNNTLAEDADRIIVGFHFDDVHGIAITGANNLPDDVQIPLPAKGEAVDIRYRFAMPLLVPGSYAITITAVTLDPFGETRLLHLLQNTLTFNASSHRQVFGLLGLPVEIEVEPVARQADGSQP
ncbi:MAG: ABC transporter ATP-binding protein [Planctomycetota bacterium]